MRIGTVQAWLSILVVLGFVVTATAVALFPVVNNLPPAAFSEHLKTIGNLYSGLIGLIVGFYFGRGYPRNGDITK